MNPLEALQGRGGTTGKSGMAMGRKRTTKAITRGRGKTCYRGVFSGDSWPGTQIFGEPKSSMPWSFPFALKSHSTISASMVTVARTEVPLRDLGRRSVVFLGVGKGRVWRRDVSKCR